MTFTKANTVERLVLGAVIRKRRAARLTVQEAPGPDRLATSTPPAGSVCPPQRSRAGRAT